MTRRWTTLACVIVCALSAEVRADAPSCGVVQDGQTAQPIAWEALSNAQVAGDTLRLSGSTAEARSMELPLVPLTLYEISAVLSRGPGSKLQFEISYLDAAGAPHSGELSWQLPNEVRPSSLPLSPHAQRYVQGFVLPAGARQARLQLRLRASEHAQLAGYSRGELSQLRVQALQAVRCCERLGRNRVLGGDLEGPERTGLPLGWTLWSGERLQWIELSGEPERKHVLRTQEGKIAVLATAFPVPVRRGEAFRIAARVRGRGRMEFMVHALSDEAPSGVRVGNERSGGLDVDAAAWTTISEVWFAEAAHIAAAQLVVVLIGRGTLEIDAIELRPYE